MKKSTGTQALERAFSVLETIARHQRQGIRLTDVAEKCSIDPSTAHRLIRMLIFSGYVEHIGDSKYLCLGKKFFELSSVAFDRDQDLIDLVRPSLIRLAEWSGDCFFLMVRSGSHAICLDRYDGDYAVRSLTRTIGGSTPLGIGTGSATILAFLNKPERAAILDHLQRKKQNDTFVPWSEDEMEHIRQQGYHYEENIIGGDIVGIAVPILTPKQAPIAAIAMGGTRDRMSEDKFSELVIRMKEEARHVEEKISKKRPPARN